MRAARLTAVAATVLPLALAPPSRAGEPARTDEALHVKVSLARENPDLSSADRDSDLLEFYVFTDGARNRGGEFGLTIAGGECVGFVLDSETAWIPLPMVRPYPGTIAQVTAGEDCHQVPLCFGRLLVKPRARGARVTVDVIPSERAGEVAIVGCDYEAVNWFVAHPAVANPGKEPAPGPHPVSRASDPLQLVPEEVVTPKEGAPPPKGSDSKPKGSESKPKGSDSKATESPSKPTESPSKPESSG